MKINPSNCAVSSMLMPAASATHVRITPVIYLACEPLTAAPERARTHIDAEVRGSVANKLRRAAQEVAESAQGLANTTKKLNRAAAKLRLITAKKAARKISLQERYGKSYEYNRRTIVGGFVKADGTADTIAYNRDIAQKTAFNVQDADGNYLFRNADGSADSAAYRRNLVEKRAKNFKDSDGNYPFRNADGSGDTTSYRRYRTEQLARNYQDVFGNHPFRRADGSGNAFAYTANIRSQRERDASAAQLLMASRLHDVTGSH